MKQPGPRHALSALCTPSSQLQQCSRQGSLWPAPTEPAVQQRLPRAEKRQLKDLAAAVDQVWHKRLAGPSPVAAALQQDQAAVEAALEEWVESQVVQHDEKKCATPFF